MDDLSSQTPVEGSQPTPPVNQNQGNEPTPEEYEWEKLRGSTQDRIRELIRQRNEFRNQLVEVSQQVPPAPQPQAAETYSQEENQLTPEQEQAVENLRKFGVWTKKDQEELERKQQEQLTVQKQELEDNILIETEYAKLEATHNGKDGLPRFDREEIEDYMKQTGIYNPEKAYEDLYRDEIFDLWAKSQSDTRPEQTYSERPSVSVGSTTEPLTLDGLRERLREKDGSIWWEKNRERLLPLLGELFK